MGRARFTLLFLAALLVGCTSTSSTATHVKLPRFVATSCHFKSIYGGDVRCGWLVVSASHRASNVRTLRLAVAIFKSQAKHAFPDPVVYLNGGPGGATLSTLGPIISLANESALLGDRDLVLVDFRGVGYSQPALNCPMVPWNTPPSVIPLWAQRQGLAAALDTELRAYRQCHDRLEHKGIDLGAYTLPEVAADIADLRLALGYKMVNLYGISYGTRIALTAMRDHPQGIRSVVLDSVVPPQWDEAMAIRQESRAFAAVFGGYEAAPTCGHQYPHLAQTFNRLLSRLQTSPITVRPRAGRPVLLTSTALAQILFDALYSRKNIPLAPQLVVQLAGGKQTTLDTMVGSLETQWSSISLGMGTSVHCGDVIEPDSHVQLSSAIHTLPLALRTDTARAESAWSALCAFWGTKAVSPREKEQISSSIPTLILDGQYDPVTPPSYGALVQKTLSHSYRFVFPGVAHGVRFTSRCASDLTWTFIDHPAQKPDSTCILGLMPAIH